MRTNHTRRTSLAAQFTLLCVTGGGMLPAQEFSSPEPDQPAMAAHVSDARSPQQKMWFRDRYISYVVVDGLAIAEGDIVLGDAEVLRNEPKPESGHRGLSVLTNSSVINGSRYRWTGNIIPYVVDAAGSLNPDMPATAQRAIEHWQQRTAYRFVARTTQANYIVISARKAGCFADVGMKGGAQDVNLGVGCLTGQAIHELGHTVGLWHEQSRNDRDSFITVMTENVDPKQVFNFDKTGANGVDTGFYDYWSVMHYETWAFSTNKKEVMATKPAGIPIGNREGLSPEDIDTAQALAGSSNRPYVITSNPPGLTITVDSVACATPCGFPGWTAGSTHTVSAPAVQNLAKTYYFARWNNNGAQAHTLTADSVRRVVTVNYTTVAPPSTAADLTVSAFTTNTASTPGGAINVTATVLNRGSANAGAFRIAFYVSSDNRVSTSDRYLGSGCAVTSVTAGASQGCTGPVTLPKDLAPGTYYLGVIADDLGVVAETDKSNNGMVNQNGATVITGAAVSAADLVVTAFTAPLSAKVGATLDDASATIRNQGSAGAGSFRLGFYISRSKTYDSSAVYTGWSCKEAAGLAAGQSTVCTGSVAIPANLAAGAYYLIAVADDLGEITEADNSNNARANDSGQTVVNAAGSPVDLLITSFATPAWAYQGDTLDNISVTVKNQGTIKAGAFRVGFYFSTTASIPNALFSGWSCNFAGLEVGASATCKGQIGVPGDLPEGSYLVYAIADDLKAVTEQSETNNTRASDSGRLAIYAW